MRYYVDTTKVSYKMWVRYMNRNNYYHCPRAEAIFSRSERYFFFGIEDMSYGHSNTTPHTRPSIWSSTAPSNYKDKTKDIMYSKNKVGGKLLC